MTYLYYKVLAKMDIRQSMESKNISDCRSVENNSDKRFQKWIPAWTAWRKFKKC